MKSPNSSKFLMLGINFLWSAFFCAICAWGMHCLLQLYCQPSASVLKFFTYLAAVIMFIVVFRLNMNDAKQNQNL